MKSLKKIIIVILFIGFTSCHHSSNTFISIGTSAYTKDDITRYALYFGFDDSIAEVKFIEHAILNEASKTVPENTKEANKLYYKFVTQMLYNLMKRESAQYDNSIPDEHFSHSFVIDYDFYLVPGSYTKRAHSTVVRPGDLPAPIDYHLSRMQPGESLSEVETKHGYFNITLREISQSPSLNQDTIQTIRNATAMAITLSKLKEKYTYRFYPENVEKKGTSDKIGEFKNNIFTVLDIEKVTLLPVKYEERYHAIRYYIEIKLLETHFASHIQTLRTYCTELARIQVYQQTYFATHKETAKLRLGATIDILTLSDKDTNTFETITLYPELQHLMNVKKGDIVTYNKQNMTVSERITAKVTQDIIEDYLLRQMFKELQKSIPVNRITQ